MFQQTRLDIIRDLITLIYGEEEGKGVFDRVSRLMENFVKQRHLPPRQDEFITERDVILITYGDMVQQPDHTPLANLGSFLKRYLAEIVNTVHILPFFPYSSDDGFSVIDYHAVNPEFGSWADVEKIAQDFKLMFDAVINHISRQSVWFQKFLAGEERYRKYFIVMDPDTDLSGVVRPRALPLLTPVSTAWGGEQHVWTTFSSDQIDLNYASPDVLIDILDLLLFYILQGADLIRLDAIAYLWKDPGTSCIHLPQTHAVVQLMRAILDEVAPDVLLITETNVPHEENVSYFGDGTNEAHLVYQFPLPPLITHTLLTGSAFHLREWAAGLKPPSPHTAFFNFTASHDGVGVRPVEDILDAEEFDALVQQALANGGQVSYKTNPDGSKSPYELNINYYDLLNSPDAGEPQSLQVRRFLTSQAIMLALAGVPGIYFHSLVGSQNYTEGVQRTGRARTINREKLERIKLEEELRTEGTLRHAVFSGYTDLIRKRIKERAFHPLGGQQVLLLPDGVFGILRQSPGERERIIALHNVTGQPQPVTLNLSIVGFEQAQVLFDIIADRSYTCVNDEPFSIILEPYQVCWLKPLPRQ